MQVCDILSSNVYIKFDIQQYVLCFVLVTSNHRQTNQNKRQLRSGKSEQYKYLHCCEFDLTITMTSGHLFILMRIVFLHKYEGKLKYITVIDLILIEAASMCISH